MAKKFHVHVYEVANKREVDLEANSIVNAKTKALQKATKGELPSMESDCRFIAIAFKKGSKKGV